jgi:Rha family phage regulatory protein
MKTETLSEDLFPETLLVNRDGDRIYTTSLKVAEYFGKKHLHVLRSIKNLIIDLDSQYPNLDSEIQFSQSNFGAREYKNTRGQAFPVFELSHDGFALLAMGFTGKVALRWKVQFLIAFREMERQLLSKTQREADVLYNLKPRWKPVVNNPSLSRLQLIAMTGHKSTGSITACRKSMKKNGLID